MPKPPIEDFLKTFAEVTETDPQGLTPDTPLAEVKGWDSLSMVMFIGTVDDLYNVQLSGTELAEAQTVKDLYEMIVPRIS